MHVVGAAAEDLRGKRPRTRIITILPGEGKLGKGEVTKPWMLIKVRNQNYWVHKVACLASLPSCVLCTRTRVQFEKGG